MSAYHWMRWLSRSHSPVWAIVAVFAFILMIVEGCVALARTTSETPSSANSAACSIFASAYNTLISDANSKDYVSFKQDEGNLSHQMGVAFSKATGAVAASLNSAMTSSAPYLLHGDASDGAVAAFNLSMVNVVQSCQASGTPVTIQTWRAQ